MLSAMLTSDAGKRLDVSSAYPNGGKYPKGSNYLPIQEV